MSERLFLKNDLLFMGPPGSGKSTIACRVSENMGGSLVNVGELFRKISGDKSHPWAEMIAGYIKRGELVGPDLLNEVLLFELKSRSSERLVFDGAVRDQRQLELFEGLMKNLGRIFITIDISTDMKTCMTRLTLRGRSDDEVETLLRRLKNYLDLTLPVIKILKTRNYLSVANGSENELLEAVLIVGSYIQDLEK